MNGQNFEGRTLIVDFDVDKKKAGYKPNLNKEENSKFAEDIKSRTEGKVKRQKKIEKNKNKIKNINKPKSELF